MKLTLANIKELKRKSDSPLTRRVCNYVIDRWGDYSDKKNGTGLYAPSELFGEKWDKEDPLAQDDYNQNLLAWFGFEETLRNIGYNFETLENCI